MGNFVFNIARGRVAELAGRVNANDPTNSALVLVVLTEDLESDSDMKVHEDLAALLAESPEASNTGYARIVLDNTAGIVITVDHTHDRVLVDFPDQTWTAVASGDIWAALLVCYDANTTSGTDANIIPLTKQDFTIEPDGRDVDALVSAEGFYRDG